MTDEDTAVVSNRPKGHGERPNSMAPHVWISADHRTPDVTAHLFVVARTTARAAVNLCTSDDHEEVLWAANAVGIALETALKLTLATVHPVLIADPKSKPGTNLVLAGGSSLKLSNKEVKSISATDAAHLVRLLHKGKVPFNLVESVLDVRNSATHMGVVEASELETAVTSMVAIVQNLLEHIGKNASEFWGDLAVEVIPRIVSDQVTRVQRRIDAKTIRARRYFEQLKRGVPESQLETLLKALEASTREEVDGEESIRQSCPVCRRDGVLRRYIEEPNFRSRFNYEIQDPGTGERYAYPDEFECFVCRLELDYDEVSEIDEFEQEEELEPSGEYEEALAEWEEEQEREREREEKLEEIRQAERERQRIRDDFEADQFSEDL